MRLRIVLALAFLTTTAHADTDRCLDQAMAMQLGDWGFVGQLESYGELVPFAGKVTISKTEDGKYRTTGSIGPNTFTNDASVKDLRTRTYNGDKVIKTGCWIRNGRYLLVQH